MTPEIRQSGVGHARNTFDNTLDSRQHITPEGRVGDHRHLPDDGQTNPAQ